jgi:hypothetical protein
VKDLSDFYADTSQVSPLRFGEALGSLMAMCAAASIATNVRPQWAEQWRR